MTSPIPPVLTLVLSACIPPAYDQPYTGRLIEHSVSPSEIRAVCRSIGERWGFGYMPPEAIKGCSTYDQNGVCEIAYVDDVARKHEIAHCNGAWHDGKGRWIDD